MALNDLPGQFVLSRRGGGARPGWSTTRLADMTLATAPGLALTPVEVDGAGRCAWVLGTIIRDGRLVDGRPLCLAAHADGPAAAVRAALPALGGRHVAIVDHGAERWIVPDAAGTSPVVFDPDGQGAASTPAALLGDAYDARYDAGLAAALGMPGEDRWYPAGLTAHSGVRRLLPGHRLDLTRWRATRDWPQAPPAAVGVEEAAEEIGTLAAGAIEAVAARQGLHLSLTAGQDSRLLLACARGVLDRVEFFTFAAPGRSLDAHVAQRLAGRFGLSHRLLAHREASPAQSEAWLRCTGHVVSGTIRLIHPTLGALDPTRMLMTGMAGETARAYYWRAGDESREGLSARELLERLHLPADPRALGAVDEWLAPLSGFPVTTVLDLAYLELRVGCWSSPQGPGSDPYIDQVIALSRRRIFELMLGLPPQVRRGELLAVEIIRRRWPELLELPFNRWSGTRRVAEATRWRLARVRAKARGQASGS